VNEERILDLLNAIEPGMTTKVTGDYVMFSCLFRDNHHRGDSRPSAGIKINDDGYSHYHCFGCGEAGGLYFVIERLLNAHPELQQVVAKKHYEKYSDDNQQDDDDMEQYIITEDDFIDRSGYLDNLPVPHSDNVLRFLQMKGITEPLGLGLLRERFSTVYMPFRVKMDDGSLICPGALTRSIYAAGKYKYSMGYDDEDIVFSTKKVFYGEWMFDTLEERVKKKIAEPLIFYLVEGPLDAIHLMQRQIPVMALAGSSVSNKKILRISRDFVPEYVIIALDNDMGGFQGTARVLKVFNEENINYKILNLGKDPKYVELDILEQEYEKIKKDVM
jgi:DNA primase